MATNQGRRDPAAFDADVIHQQLGALSDAATQRHRLAPGTAEYEAALEIEERLAEHLWRLATDLPPNGSDRSEPER